MRWLAGSARRVSLRRAVCLLLVVAFATTGCQQGLSDDDGFSDVRRSSDPGQPVLTGPVVGKPLLLLHFGRTGAVEYHNAGAGPLGVDVMTWNAGTLRPAEGPGGRAVRLPPYRPSDPGFAVVRVQNDTKRDWLRPVGHNFAFGASFSLNRQSDGTTADNGDNLMQRGLFDSPSMYKIQVDHGVVSCMIKGMTGEAYVEAARPVVPERWYRVRCKRLGDTVTLAYAPILANGRSGPWTKATARAELGPVLMPVETPLSIGGKLAGDGTLTPASTDQFNGRIDEVFLRLLKRRNSPRFGD